MGADARPGSACVSAALGSSPAGPAIEGLSRVELARWRLRKLRMADVSLAVWFGFTPALMLAKVVVVFLVATSPVGPAGSSRLSRVVEFGSSLGASIWPLPLALAFIVGVWVFSRWGAVRQCVRAVPAESPERTRRRERQYRRVFVVVAAAVGVIGAGLALAGEPSSILLDLGALIGLVAAGMVFAVGLVWRSGEEIVCAACSYPLLGGDDGILPRCPECGREWLDGRGGRLGARSRIWPLMFAGGVLWMAVLVGVLISTRP